MRKQHSLAAALTLVLLGAPGVSPLEAPASEPPGDEAMLRLKSGGFVRGKLGVSKQEARLRWKGSAFVEPLDFALDRVAAVQFPVRQPPPRAEGAYRFELAGDGVVFGALQTLDEASIVIDAGRHGRLRLERSSVRRIDRWDNGAGVVYMGPSGSTGWHALAGGRWSEESGYLETDQPASIQNDLDLPARASIEFELSWKDRPDFVLALGVGAGPDTLGHAFRFEVWEGEAVVYRETVNRADVAPVQKLDDGPGRLHLTAYLDRPHGQIVVCSGEGKRLAELKVEDPKAALGTSIALLNVRGDIRLERLRVMRWEGALPGEMKPGAAHLELADGSIVEGDSVRFDAAAGEWLVRQAEGERRFAAARLATAVLAGTDVERPADVVAIYQDGSRFGGKLLGTEEGALTISMPGASEPARLAIAGLRSLIVSDRKPAVTERSEKASSLPGRLELDGVQLRGHLVDGAEKAGASCLVWDPDDSTSTSPLRPGVSGRIVYKETRHKQAQDNTTPPATGMVVVPRGRDPAKVIDAIVVANAPVRMRVDGALVSINRANPPSAGGRPANPSLGLHLRTGDYIACRVVRIDEEGIWIKSPVVDSEFVAHAKVGAIELAPIAKATVALDPTKRERLLTLPRMQKGNPPTHLICSTNGDYLRGRVVAMNERVVKVEIHLETIDIPRERVARIIWFHAEEPEPSAKEAKPAEGPASTRVQALRGGGGTRLTFQAERVSGKTIEGKSDILGACRAELNQVDELLIGSAIEADAARLAYSQWQLHDAALPKIDTGDGGTSPAVDSPLVGAPAPDFELAMLGEGKRFHLARRKGQVIVLDFWATWCGPCVKSMPEVERVAREFADRNVALVAVNLQEPAEKVAEMLKRTQLKVDVALDSNGAVAGKYGVTAIPQTVIIGADGNVARVFVGGGPHLADELREALRSLVSGSDPPAEKDKGN
jgi:peroxiredoxin